MNFALLGDDPAVVPLIEAIADHADHALIEAALVGEQTLSAALALSPGLHVAGGWDVWLSQSEIDAVIVAGDDETVLEGARRLAATGMSLVLIPTPGQGLAFVYEMSLIRDDTHVGLCPAFLGRFEPALVALRAMLEAGKLGPLMHLQLERARSDAASHGKPRLLSRTEIDEALLDDVDLLRYLAGSYHQVTALHTGTAADRAALAQVTLAGDDLPEASWSFKATQPGPPWKLVVIGQQRTVVLSREGANGPLRFETDDVDFVNSPAPLIPAARLLENCEAMRDGLPFSPDWTDLTQAFELVDAARRSLKRRRTIDVYFETASERSVFKTQMTAVGCGLLVFTFLAVLAVLIIGTLFEPGDTVMLVLRALVFLPLLLFLLLQFLLLVARPSVDGPSADD